ncbi:MAG: hypothetical protein LBK13_04715 [Spirochaetales bacterium]|jgi:hypothetical protein|nr:hypothetical protein [Spirochaetales bacterium]
MQFLWAFRCNPLRMAAQNQARKLPLAISWAKNCLRQFFSSNPAAAILLTKLRDLSPGAQRSGVHVSITNQPLPARGAPGIVAEILFCRLRQKRLERKARFLAQKRQKGAQIFSENFTPGAFFPLPSFFYFLALARPRPFSTER